MFPVSSTTLRRVWQAIGWFGIVLLLYLSLTPRPPEIPMDNGDKFGHGLAYAVLYYWWAQICIGCRRRIGLAAGLTALGIVIEYLQGWSGWRTFDPYDMLADAAGVALGWLLASRSWNILSLLQRHCLRS